MSTWARTESSLFQVVVFKSTAIWAVKFASLVCVSLFFYSHMNNSLTHMITLSHYFFWVISDLLYSLLTFQRLHWRWQDQQITLFVSIWTQHRCWSLVQTPSLLFRQLSDLVILFSMEALTGTFLFSSPTIINFFLLHSLQISCLFVTCEFVFCLFSSLL